MQMIRYKSCVPPLLAAGALSLLASTIRAQFPGDLFFAKPSVSVPHGATAELHVRAFTGSSVLGAYAVALEFDPAQLEVVAIAGGDPAEWTAFAEARREDEPGRVRFGASNGRSADRPFGTVDLATLTVRPKVAVGKSVDVKLHVLSLIDGQVQPFARKQGYSARLTIVSPGPSPGPSFGPGFASGDPTTPPQLINGESAPWLDHFARRMRPAGAIVEFELPTWFGRVVRPRVLSVRTRDPRAAPDDR